MKQETMTPRERWQAVLSGHKPDRLPLDYWATPKADEKLRRHLGCSSRAELEARLHIDRPLHLAPRYIGPPLAPDQDLYGCRYRDVAYAQGIYRNASVIRYLISIRSKPSRRAIPGRLPTGSIFRTCRPGCRQDHLPLAAGGSEPFLVYKNLRGGEQAFMDLLLQPEIVDYCLDKLFAWPTSRPVGFMSSCPGASPTAMSPKIWAASRP